MFNLLLPQRLKTSSSLPIQLSTTQTESAKNIFVHIKMFLVIHGVCLKLVSDYRQEKNYSQPCGLPFLVLIITAVYLCPQRSSFPWLLTLGLGQWGWEILRLVWLPCSLRHCFEITAFCFNLLMLALYHFIDPHKTSRANKCIQQPPSNAAWL